MWTQQFGTSRSDQATAVQIDSLGNPYVSGYTEGSLEGINAGSVDAFLTKFDSSGTEVWTQQIGTADVDYSFSVAVDSSGNSYITGSTRGVLEGTNAGSDDAFLTKFDSVGNEVWTQQIGTVSRDIIYSVAVDSSGNAFISGRTDGDLEGTNAGSPDAFLTKFDSSGNEVWTRQIGTSSSDQSLSVAVDAAGSAFISGVTGGSLSARPPGAGGFDAFLTKFDSSGNELWTQQVGASGLDEGFSVTVDDVGNAFISGRAEGNLGGVSAGSADAFVMKFSAPSAAVPEPSSLVLVSVAGCMLLHRKRRQVYPNRK